jgi:hypothetical protein
MSATVADLDNDGLLDIYVTNDAMGNYYYRNLGNGTFEEDGLIRGLSFGEGGQGVSSMGPSIADMDRDGWLDVYIPDMGYGCLLMNREGFFEDHTARAKLAVVCGQYTGWGVALLDFDNDGYTDAFISNGHAHFLFGEEDVLVRNNRTGSFVDVAAQSGEYFRSKRVGRGTTWGDFDNDGDQDLLVVNLNDTARLLRNDGGNKNNWLTVEAKLPGSGRHAIGARITVKTGALVQVQDLIPVRGYLSQGDPRMSFGLGASKVAESLEIRWPDGRTTTRSNIPANQFLTIIGDAE